MILSRVLAMTRVGEMVAWQDDVGAKAEQNGDTAADANRGNSATFRDLMVVQTRLKQWDSSEGIKRRS